MSDFLKTIRKYNVKNGIYKTRKMSEVGLYDKNGLIKKLILGSDVKTLYELDGMDNLEEIVFNDSITTIKEGACVYIENIKELNFPKSLEKILGDAFRGCENLKKITFNSLTKLDTSCFSLCESIDTIVFNYKDKCIEINIPEGYIFNEINSIYVNHYTLEYENDKEIITIEIDDNLNLEYKKTIKNILDTDDDNIIVPVGYENIYIDEPRKKTYNTLDFSNITNNIKMHKNGKQKTIYGKFDIERIILPPQTEDQSFELCLDNFNIDKIEIASNRTNVLDDDNLVFTINKCSSLHSIKNIKGNYIFSISNNLYITLTMNKEFIINNDYPIIDKKNIDTVPKDNTDNSDKLEILLKKYNIDIKMLNVIKNIICDYNNENNDKEKYYGIIKKLSL